MNHIITGIVLLLVGFAGGYFTTNQNLPTSAQREQETSVMHEDDEHVIQHESLINVPEAQAPTVALEVLNDPMGGYNAKITTTNFRFAPEHVSTEHMLGEGHAHIYVDGVKINRMYGPWYSLGKLPEGVHEIRVDLSANDHSAYAVNGQKISDSVTVTVEPTIAFDAAKAVMFDVSITDRSLIPQTVTVTEGESVHLRVQTDEGGEFHITGYEIVQAIRVGSITDVMFVADKPGRYVFELHPEGGHADYTEGDHDAAHHGSAAEDIEIGALMVTPR